VPENARFCPVFGYIFRAGCEGRNISGDFGAKEKSLSLYKWVRRVKVLDVFFENLEIFLKIIFASHGWAWIRMALNALKAELDRQAPD
jgi:hypothetical protein